MNEKFRKNGDGSAFVGKKTSLSQSVISLMEFMRKEYNRKETIPTRTTSVLVN